MKTKWLISNKFENDGIVFEVNDLVNVDGSVGSTAWKAYKQSQESGEIQEILLTAALFILLNKNSQ